MEVHQALFARCVESEGVWFVFLGSNNLVCVQVSVVTETALSVGTSDADSVHLQFETFQEANSWLATLTLRKK